MKLYSQYFYHEKFQLNRFNVTQVNCFCFMTTFPPSDWANTLKCCFVLLFLSPVHLNPASLQCLIYYLQASNIVQYCGISIFFFAVQFWVPATDPSPYFIPPAPLPLLQPTCPPPPTSSHLPPPSTSSRLPPDPTSTRLPPAPTSSHLPPPPTSSHLPPSPYFILPAPSPYFIPPALLPLLHSTCPPSPYFIPPAPSPYFIPPAPFPLLHPTCPLPLLYPTCHPPLSTNLLCLYKRPCFWGLTQ